VSNLGAFYRYIGWLAFGYAAVTASAYLIKDTVTLVDVVTIGKIFSLIALLLVNGDVPRAVDKQERDIKIINYLILIGVILITIISSIKFLGLDLNESTASPIIKSALGVIYKHIFWLSALPLIAYAILDFYIAYFRRGRLQEQQTALKFFVFVDMVCVLPLALVYILSIIHAEFITGEKFEAAAFSSGSMAIVLLSSAIATKAVDVFLESENSNTIE